MIKAELFLETMHVEDSETESLNSWKKNKTINSDFDSESIFEKRTWNEFFQISVYLDY